MAIVELLDRIVLDVHQLCDLTTKLGLQGCTERLRRVAEFAVQLVHILGLQFFKICQILIYNIATGMQHTWYAYLFNNLLN